MPLFSVEKSLTHSFTWTGFKLGLGLGFGFGFGFGFGVGLGFKTHSLTSGMPTITQSS